MMAAPSGNAAATAPTRIYVHADFALKGPALAARPPPNTSSGRDRAVDQLLVFVESPRYAEPVIARSPLSRETAGRRASTRHNSLLGIG